MAMGKMVMVKRRKGRPRKIPPSFKTFVKKEIEKNIENKVNTLDLDDNFLTVGTTWVEHIMCNPAQGDGMTQRSGRQIKIKSLEIKGVLSAAADGSALDENRCIVRIIIGLFQGTVATPLATAGATINSPITRDQMTRGRLVTKYLDRYVPLDVTSTEKGAGDGYAPQQKGFRYFKRFNKPITITYGDDTATYPDKLLFLSMISDSAAVPNPGFVLSLIHI